MTVLVPLARARPAARRGRSPSGSLRHPRIQRDHHGRRARRRAGRRRALLVLVDQHGTIVVQVGGWHAPFGISLVVDRLCALHAAVSASVLLAVLVFSIGQGLAADDSEAPVTIFYPTYLRARRRRLDSFIAGDLFNLYVGFEMLLVASYVLITLGGSEQRVRAGTTYIVVSLIASALFLAAIALVYAATGTVNIAQIAERDRPGCRPRAGAPARDAAHRVRHQGRRVPAGVLAARLATRPRPPRSPRCSPACSPRSASTRSSGSRRCCSRAPT